MGLILFRGLRPFNRSGALRDALAGVTLASMNIPQVLGYARIAGMPVVTGLYTVLLPLVAFAVFGSSRHLVVAADSATAAIFSSSLSRMAAPASEKYMALVGMVALLTAGLLLAGADLQAGVPRRFPVAHGAGRVSHRRRVSGRHRDARRHVRCHGAVRHDTLVQAVGDLTGPAAVQSSDAGAVRARGGRHPARQSLCPAIAAVAVRGSGDDRGERRVPLRRARHRGHRPGPGGLPSIRLPDVSWSEVLALLPVAASCFVMIIAQSAATSRAFALRYHERVDEDADILGLAAANAAAAAERDLRGQRQPDADRHGGSRGRAQPGRATGICGRSCCWCCCF